MTTETKLNVIVMFYTWLYEYILKILQLIHLGNIYMSQIYARKHKNLDTQKSGKMSVNELKNYPPKIFTSHDSTVELFYT